MDVETPQGEKSQRKEELDNNPAVRSAIAFLNDPRVKRTPTDRKIKFLKGKGLSSEEIKYAFEKCGLPPLTLEQISAVQPLETGTGALSTPSSAAANPSARSAYLFPQSAPAPVESEAQEPSLDWRDVVIGSGVTALIAVAGYKFLKNFSPYEIRRKASPDPEARRAAEAEERVAQAKKTPLPTPPAISPLVLEELEQVKKELQQATELLTAERKKSSEVAINAAKLRAEKLQVAHTNDKLNREIEELKEKLKKYEEEELKKYEKEEKEDGEEIEKGEDAAAEEDENPVKEEGGVEIVESFNDLSNKPEGEAADPVPPPVEDGKKHVKFADEPSDATAAADVPPAADETTTTTTSVVEDKEADAAPAEVKAAEVPPVKSAKTA